MDNCTSLGWSILLATKDQAYPELKKWELARERETGLKIGTYRTNNSELKSDKVEEYLASQGTQHQYTITPSWGNLEPCKVHANYHPIGSMSLYSQLAISRIEYRPLHLITIPHHTKPTMGKSHLYTIYERSTECVLVGYSLDSKAYRLYHWPTHKVVVSYNVSFIESKDLSPRTFQPGRVLPVPSNPSYNKLEPTPDSGLESVHTAPPTPGTSPAPSLTPSPPTSPPAPSSPASHRASVSPELELPQPAAPPSALFPEPEPQCSAWGRLPLERAAEREGIQYLSAVQRAVAESQESLHRLQEERNSRL